MFANQNTILINDGNVWNRAGIRIINSLAVAVIIICLREWRIP